MKISQEALQRITKTSIQRLPNLKLLQIKSKKKKQKQVKQNKQIEKRSSQKNTKPSESQKQVIKPPKMKIVQEQLKPEDSYKPESSFDQTSENNENNQNQSDSSSDSGKQRETQRRSGSDSSYAHFVVFMQNNYRLIPQPAKRKQNFLRREPIFERYQTQIKIDNHNDHSICLPAVGLQSFRKYMKKYHKSQGLKYQQKRNMYRMKIVMGICMKTNNNRGGGGQND